MGTTDHLTLLQLFFHHWKEKIRKFFCECNINDNQILSVKNGYIPKMDIFRLYFNNITVEDTFVYKHTLIACAIVHGSLSTIKTSTASSRYIRCDYYIVTHSIIDYYVI